MTSQLNNPSHGFVAGAVARPLCVFCKSEPSDQVFLKVQSCKLCRNKLLGLKTADKADTCNNCGCLLTNMERDYGHGLCIRCDDPGRQEIH